MPKIKSSTDLRNNYNEISTFCREHKEPVFITKNGQGDLAVMSIDLYEQMTAREDLYRLLGESHKARIEGRHRPFEEFMDELLAEFEDIANEAV